jgi:hypothetical protein
MSLDLIHRGPRRDTMLVEPGSGLISKPYMSRMENRGGNNKWGQKQNQHRKDTDQEITGGPQRRIRVGLGSHATRSVFSAEFRCAVRSVFLRTACFERFGRIQRAP